MNSRKFKIVFVLTMVMGCLLLSIGSAVAFSQGYLTRFIVNDVEISRDEFVALADASMLDQSVNALHCAQMQFSLHTGLVTYCVDTHEEVSAFLDSH